MMLFILFLLILSFIFAVFRYAKTSAVILLVTIICFFMNGCGIIPFLLLKPLQSLNIVAKTPQWDKRNAIVILGAGTIKSSNKIIPSVMSYSRIYEGARLYFSCKKSGFVCVVMVSGGDVTGTGASEAVVYKKSLLQLNINDADIMIEPNSLNTYKNAEYMSAILKHEKFERVFLVTSGVHLKRALLYFSHFGIDAESIPSDYMMPEISIVPLGYNFALTDFALHEYMGIIRFHLYSIFGWDAKISSAGAV